jgi:hypothetical protein
LVSIAGGITGLLLTVWLIAHTVQITGLILLILLFATGLYSFSIYCGHLLMTNKYLKAFKLSLINQAIQILQFAMLGYAFWYASGLMFTLGMKVNNGFTFTFDFGLFSTYQISLATIETEFKLAINLVAIYVIYFILNLRSTIVQEKINFDFLEISNEKQEERLAYEE